MDLTTGEFFVAKTLALTRLRIDKERGIKDRLHSQNGEEFTAINGACGEIALAKMANVFPNLSIEPVSADNGTDKGDLVAKRPIDVKTTFVPDCPIRVEPQKKPNVDYALVTGDYREAKRFTFRGVISGKELIQERRLIDFKGRKKYTAYQHELSNLT